jgi:hypothetical protein
MITSKFKEQKSDILNQAHTLCVTTQYSTETSILEDLMNNFYVSAYINFSAECQVTYRAFCIVHMNIHVLF